ncbi:hypothetical protein LRAMOSA09002 [Lichtheimia ramosa]|uniref:Thioredoxin domain-containing protein n=1 Tax=Lichtheimia ramosa TaxID=688394 RepID=A0A077WH67_9FUNG|nr:hypothetical protein LRAMOSA09002 [Lichtheimia ramosa]
MSISYPKNIDEFNKLITENNKAVIDFTASWSGACKMMDPTFDTLAVENPEIAFAKVDIDQHPDIPAALDITAVPTFSSTRMFDYFIGPGPSQVTERTHKLKLA